MTQSEAQASASVYIMLGDVRSKVLHIASAGMFAGVPSVPALLLK
jgi:hypothetical protein